MKRVPWVLALACLVTAVQAQTCPTPDFQQGAMAQLFQPSSAGGLVRQANGSFTEYLYQTQSPYTELGVVSGYQSVLLNCAGAGARTFKTPPGWVPMANQPGAPTQPAVFANLLGNGTPVGLTTVQGGTFGAAVDSLLIAIPNSNGSVKSSTYYAVPSNPAGVLAADVNNDGKQDVVVVSYGDGSNPNTVAVFLGNGDGTVQPAILSPAGVGATVALAYDFNGDNKLDLAVLAGGNVAILPGNGNGAFGAPVNYPAGESLSLVLGDFNGDGHADLILGGFQSLSVMLGNSNGSFQSAVGLTETFTATYMAVGDFNNDKKLDLAVTDFNGNTLSILLGDGTGKFASQNEYIAGISPTNIMAVDVDGDGNLDVVIGQGHPDVLTTDFYSDYVTVFFGRGDGTLIGPPAYNVGSSLTSMALADFNGDGVPDLAVVGPQIWILLSAGNGTFSTPVQIAIPSVSASSVAAADLNHDGKQDLVVGDANGSGVYVLLGNGNGTFQTPLQYPVGGYVTSVAIADFNLDTKPDIAFCGDGETAPTGSTAGVLLGNGNGTFQSVKSLTGFGSGPHALTVADFNGDNKPDLAIANEGGYQNGGADAGGVLVFLNSGAGSFQAPASYPAGLYPHSIVAADVNSDNVPDLMVTAEDTNFNTNFQYDVGVLLANANGTFRTTSLIPTEFGPSFIAVAELTANGKQDLVIAHCCGDTDVTIMSGNGNGTFQPEVEYPGIISTSTLLVADINNDGQPDIVAGISDGNTSFAGVFLNTSGQPTLTPVTIQTSPAGLQFSVNGGAAQAAPQTLNLSQGTQTIAVATTQAGSAGSQYVFTSWSDNGAASHNITVGSSAATYTATFQTQYQLTIAASPPAGGTVTPASGTFYNAGSAVPITATANSGYSFSSWSGSVANLTSASTTVTMAAPETVAANFTSGGAHPAFFAGEDNLGSGVYYLAFPNGTLFGYYAYTGGGWIDHFDMGYEYVDPGTGTNVYFWDLSSRHWWYTSTTEFPYLYDFTLNAWLYYYPNPQSAGHYSTNPRYFVNLTTNQIFTM